MQNYLNYRDIIVTLAFKVGSAAVLAGQCLPPALAADTLWPSFSCGQPASPPVWRKWVERGAVCKLHHLVYTEVRLGRWEEGRGGGRAPESPASFAALCSCTQTNNQNSAHTWFTIIISKRLFSVNEGSTMGV